MTADAQEALVEIFRVLERVGLKRPTNDLVIDTARRAGARFRDGEAKTLLAKFRNVGDRPGTDRGPVRPDAGPVSPHVGTDAGPNATQPGTDLAGATRASTKELPSSQSLFPDGTTVPSAPSALQRGHELRDAVCVLVTPHLNAMTPRSWKSVNGKFAHDMIEAGVTIAEAVEVWQAEYDRTNYPIIKLQTLQERINMARSRRELAATGRGTNAHGVQTIAKADRR